MKNLSIITSTKNKMSKLMKIFFTGIFLLFSFLIANISSAQELKTITAEEFLAQNPSPERQKIVDFIVGQLDDKQSLKITQKQLDQIWNHKNNHELEMIRFQIIDQKLYVDSHDSIHLRSRSLINYFQYLVNNYQIPNIDFIIYACDFIPLDNKLPKEVLEFPAFMMSKNLISPYEKNKLLLPDIYVASGGWRKLIKTISEANPKNHWNNKMEIIFWRGASNNGLDNNLSNFSQLPRLKLVVLSKLYPDLVDAQFSKYVQFSQNSDGKKLREILNILWGKNPQDVKESDHLKYKYLISLDGNSCAWMRVPWIMLSNSVLLKQETDNIQWFYPAITPYTHYVPIKKDLTDIFSQLEWAKNHDAELQKIVGNANNFIKNNLMPEDIDAYMLIILNQYSKLQQNEKIIATLPELEEKRSLWTLLKILFSQIKDKFTFWIDSL